jgi:hypothetical protein
MHSDIDDDSSEGHDEYSDDDLEDDFEFSDNLDGMTKYFETFDIKNNLAEVKSKRKSNNIFVFNDNNFHIRPAKVVDNFIVKKSIHVRSFSFDDIFCDDTNNRRYLISKDIFDDATFANEADVSGFMKSLIQNYFEHCSKLDYGFENIQSQIKMKLEMIKKQKNHKKRMGKQKRVVKDKNNTSAIEIVDWLDPVATAGVNEQRLKVKKQKDWSSNVPTISNASSIKKSLIAQSNFPLADMGV